jgi:mRNA-degrading endonuclease toxin of MazEF toxin-antitoxin module
MPGRPRGPRPDPPPYRGDVWDVAFPRIGDHPAVALTTNALRGRLSSVTVALVTGREGPPMTHVELDESAGLTKYPVSYANVTDLHTVPVTRCRRFRGRLSASEMGKVTESLALVLGLPSATTRG